MRILKKMLKRLAIALGILIAVGLVVNAVLVWQTGKHLEERLSKLRTAGDPLSLPELGAMPVAPGADAAAVLKRIEPEIKAFHKEIGPLMDGEMHPRPWPDADWNALEKAYANYPTILPALQEVAACPSYKSPLNYHVPAMADENDVNKPDFLKELLPWILMEREAANILKYRAELQLRAKDRDGAMRTCLTALRIAWQTEKEPMFISYLVVVAVRSVAMGVANKILHDGPVAADLHKELEAELARFDSTDAYRWALRSERAYGLQAYEEMNLGGWFSRAYNNDEKCYYLDQMDEWFRQAGDSYAKSQADSASGRVVPHGVRHILSRLIVPAFILIRDADFRMRCLVRSLRVLNALTEKKLTEVPANLTDLGLPAGAVMDPYTDKPLIVKRTDGQWIVYGLGPNLKDDGGLLEKFEDVGYGPVKSQK